MKRVKRLLILVLSMVMVLGVGVSYAETGGKTLNDTLLNHYSEDLEDKIDLITRMEIVMGSDEGLELERGLTRAEGATVYTNLFGLTQDAIKYQKENAEYKTPFNDLPDWAKKYVNYLYKEGLTSGVSDKKFGAKEEMTAEQFVTMILRGLGYSDKDGEFVWNKSLDKAVEIGLLSEKEKKYIEKEKLFTREEMIIVAYNALFTENKDSKDLLIESRNPGDKHITRLLYTEITQEEYNEILKTKKKESYKVFNTEPEKQKALYDKIKKFHQEAIDLYNFNVEGKKVDYKLTSIYMINYKEICDEEFLLVGYNDGFLSFLKLKDSKILIEDDKWLAEDLFMQISCLRANEMHPEDGSWIKMDKREMNDDTFSADIALCGTEKYLYSAKTKTVDYRGLNFEIDLYTK